MHLVLLSIMIVNELTVFASLTVRFLRGVCQVLRSAQRLTVSRPGIASARQRIPLRREIDDFAFRGAKSDISHFAARNRTLRDDQVSD